MTRKARPVSPHVLKQNDRVYQRYCPWNTGIVSHVEAGVRFTVVYDTPNRKSREPRDRYTYSIDVQDQFLIGEPPVVGDPTPVHTEAFGHE